MDELLVTYIEETNDFIDKLINHQRFRPNERQLDEYFETCLRNNPKYTAYGFYMDSANPGGFIYGYKFRPGVRMSKMVFIRLFLGDELKTCKLISIFTLY